MPVPLVQQDTGDLWNKNAGDYLPSTTWDATVAAANLATDSTSLGVAGDFYLQNKFEQMPLQKTLSVQELNEKYMGSGINWSSPQKEIVADMIAKRHEQLAMYRNRAATGGNMLNLATTLAVGAGDPLMMAGGMALGAAMRGTALLPKVLQGEGLISSLGRGAVEGGALMVPLEAATVARDETYMRDTSMTHSLQNIGMGMAFGATAEGLRFAARELPGRIRNAADAWLGRNTKAEDNVRFTELAATQMLEGKRPTLEPAAEHLRRERGFSDQLPHEYVPTDASVPVTKEYYVGSQSQAEQLHTAAPETRNSSTDFGPGLYGSDHLAAENGYAASDLHEAPGLIHRFETQEARLFDSEKPLDEGTAAMLAGELKPIDPQLAKDVASGEVTIRQAYEGLPSEGKALLNRKLSEMGYDGLHYTEGEGNARRNGVMIFPDKAENVRVSGEPFQADASVKGGLSQSEMQAAYESYTQKENDIFHSREEQEAFALEQERVESYDAEDPAMVDEAHALAVQQLSQLEGKGLLTEAQKAQVQEILGKSNKGDKPSLKESRAQGEGILKEMANCIVEH